ncbi:MAG: carbamoyltransferase C-terminal domain-containing protein [Candidatus Omnitrophota bacterium]|nr:carbamoyltransferase C-terminal domain-containing protein [Candidatus Omnitrophota bacterium]
MHILGLSGGFRQGNMDGAACLIRGNSIIAAAEEERFARIKHAPGLIPLNAIKYCLSEAKISIREVDLLVFSGSTYKGIKDKLRSYFLFRFGSCPEIALVEHHLAHASSAFFVSGFKDAGILTMDLSGDGISTLLAYGKGPKITKLREFRRPNSLGAYYNLVTQYLGFNRNNDEYKVMGLSSYGKPVFDLSWLLKKDAAGYIFNLNAMRKVPAGQSFPSMQEPLYSRSFLNHFTRPRVPGSRITRYHMDFAASAQNLLEDVIVHLAVELYRLTGSRNLCVAGGVGLNCVANARLRKLPFVDNIFIPPASSDAGMAMGSALKIAVGHGCKFERLSHAYYGPGYSNTDIERALKHIKCDFRRCDNVASFTAKKISEGKIIGWFQSRMEYGPRALGARSILADPAPADMKDRINHLVKFRESFRPFAPSILEEQAAQYFDGASDAPFMTMNFDARKDKINKMRAVVHVDGTSRVQTVKRSVNPIYYDMIKHFYRLSSTPVVLNTSFNVRDEPVVCTPYQAVASFYQSGLDCLVIGDYILEKRKNKL